ncbi:MAG: PIN domain-containing protein [Clostridiales bacterium]|jgi:tRNA(fMet)-specific endonuclease VapC|nr:PIN domain-containing protein [Clostridiales bacterium]
MIYAFDTNTLIFLLNNDKKVMERRDISILVGDRFIIPPVVDYEIQRGLLYRPSPRKEKIYFALRNHYGVGFVEPEMWVKSAHIYVELRKKGFTVTDGDVFIAAYCILNDYTLITRNVKDFENIEGMKFVNWIDS